MAQWISLSRAARLVGVKRGTLQQQIRSGALQTFEGEIRLADLLQAYPDAQVEDSSMLERVEQIIEQASFINVEHAARKPDNVALTTRVMALSAELSTEKLRLEAWRQHHSRLLAKIESLKDSSAPLEELRSWLESATAGIEQVDDTIDQSRVNETFRRVMTGTLRWVKSRRVSPHVAAQLTFRK